MVDQAMITKTEKNLDVILISGSIMMITHSPQLVWLQRSLMREDTGGRHRKTRDGRAVHQLGALVCALGSPQGPSTAWSIIIRLWSGKRIEDEHSDVTRIPDRAVIYYCNKLKQSFKTSVIVIGGIESSLRRFAHYDYWDNNIRRSILLDSRRTSWSMGMEKNDPGDRRTTQTRQGSW